MKVIIIDKTKKIEEKEISRKDTKNIFSLHIRDLRPIFSYLQVSTILPRKDVVIINLGFLKTILSKDEVYIFSNNQENEVFKSFIGELKSKIENKNEIFFLNVFETILEAKARQINFKIDKINDLVKIALENVHKKTSEEYLKNILILKKKVSQLEIRVKEILSAGREVLEDDENFEDLQEIFNIKKDEEISLELESILENFLEQMEENLSHITRLQEDIDDTDQYLNLSLSSQRTYMTKIEVFTSLISLVFALLAVIVGSFGMNLKNNHENSYEYFLYVNIGLLIIFIISLIIFWYFLKKKKIF